jgi:hypothetical protein
MKKRYKRKEEDLVESFEQKIRELKSENRQLHKRLKKVSKGYKAYLDNDLEDDIIEEKREEKKICWDCARGELLVKIVLNRRWRECTICNKRTKVKIIEV